MQTPVTSTTDQAIESDGDNAISMSREKFNQRLKQAERAGARKFLEEAGLTAETTPDQLNALLQYGTEKTGRSGNESTREIEDRYKSRIQTLEGHIEALQRSKKEELEKERNLREQVVVKESLLRAYLANNGLPAEVNPHAQETALRDMLNLGEVKFVVNDNNTVSVANPDGAPVYVDGQPLTLAAWVQNYLNTRPYLMRSKGKGNAIGQIDKPIASLTGEEIRTAASNKYKRLEMGKSL